MRGIISSRRQGAKGDRVAQLAVAGMLCAIASVPRLAIW